MKRAITSILTLISILFISCAGDEDKGNYLTGSVNYTGDGNGEVSVRLYPYPEINDTLTQIRYDYPQVGVACTNDKLRELLFDKNAQPAVASTSTNSKGKWELKNLETGEYVLVFNKNHAYKFQYAQNVGNGENNTGNIELVKAIELKNDTTITQDMLVPSGSNLYIEGVATIDEFIKLTIEDNVNIVFADSSAELDKGGISVLGDGEIEFLGQEENWINVFGEGDSLKNAWARIKIGENGKGKFRYSRISNGTNAVFFLKSSPDVENCVFVGCETALGFEMNRGGNLHDLMFMDCNIGLFANQIDSLNIYQNLSYNNKKAVSFYGPGSYNLNNSIFNSNNTACYMNYKLKGTTENCLFKSNTTAFLVSGDETKVFKNSFIDNKLYDISIDCLHESVVSQITVNYNNFYNNDIINVRMVGYTWGANGLDINAKHNWWTSETDSLFIENRIIDKDDAGELAHRVGQVLFVPVVEDEIENTGIE